MKNKYLILPVILLTLFLFNLSACSKAAAKNVSSQSQTIASKQTAQADTKIASSAKNTADNIAVSPAAEANQGDNIIIPTQTPEEEKKEEAKAQDDIINDDGRLTHPWYYAPQITNYQGKTPKWFGETLKFKIGWSFVTAGEAILSTPKIVNIENQPAFQVEAQAKSYAVIDKIFKVRDINVSWVAADLKRSLGYWQSVREGKYARDEWLTFDYKTHTFINHKQDRHGNIETQPAASFKGNEIFDILSALYFVRSQELPLKGEVYFDIVNRTKQYPLKVIVHGKETVKVKAGKFDCILVEPLFSGEGIFVSKGKSLKVWLTDDEYKMPVRMSVEVMVGSVYGELVEYTRK
ncbi:MAG: DUF3108 domain-containing protein [Elusimicrobiota bacterium]|jgi:hypothetical protein|nr:DUF3108 domain-containing protein [Elusimicrobiota bacterium]